MRRELRFRGKAEALAQLAWRARKERLPLGRCHLRGGTLTLSYELRHPSAFIEETGLVARLTDGLSVRVFEASTEIADLS